MGSALSLLTPPQNEPNKFGTPDPQPTAAKHVLANIVIALAFLFDLAVNASLLWPVLLIIGGVAVLLQAISK